MTEALGASSGRAFCTVKKTPFRFTASSSSNCVSVTDSNGAGPATAAATNSTSSRSQCSRSEAIRWSMSASLPASLCSTTTSPPKAWRACARAAVSRPVMATRAPCSRKSLAAARPMPLVPPVISAVLPASFCMVSVRRSKRLHPHVHRRAFFAVDAHIGPRRPLAAQDRFKVERLQVVRRADHMAGYAKCLRQQAIVHLRQLEADRLGAGDALAVLDHAERAVVEHDEHDAQPLRRSDGDLLAVHQVAAVAGDADHRAARVACSDADRRADRPA